MPRSLFFDPMICDSALDVSFRLGSALSWRGAVPELLAKVASRACGQPITHRELDLAAVDTDVPQRTIVEPLELANGAAPVLFGGYPSREARTSQDEQAQPLHSRAHAGLDEEIALDGGLSREFEGGQWRHAVTGLGHRGSPGRVG